MSKSKLEITVIDFMALRDKVNTKFGVDDRDMAGRYTKEGQAEYKAAMTQWLLSNGYQADEPCLNCKDPVSREDWEPDSPEMRKRIEINTKMRDVSDSWYRPDQDVWHYLIDNQFYECTNSSVHWANFSHDEDAPDYVNTYYSYIREVLKEEGYNPEGDYQYYVAW